MAQEIVLRVQNEVVGLETREIKPQKMANKRPEPQRETENKLKTQAKDNVGKIIAMQMGQKAAQFALQNYGNLTGDNMGQQQLNDALGVFGMGAMALYGGLPGVAMVAAQIAITGINRYVEIEKSRITSKNMQARVGITIGGSR